MAKDALREVNAHNVDAINKVAFMPKEEPKKETFFADGGHVETKKKGEDKIQEVNKFNLKKFSKKENLFLFGGISDLANDVTKQLLQKNGNTFTSQLPGGHTLTFGDDFNSPSVKDSLGNTIKPAGAATSDLPEFNVNYMDLIKSKVPTGNKPASQTTVNIVTPVTQTQGSSKSTSDSNIEKAKNAVGQVVGFGSDGDKWDKLALAANAKDATWVDGSSSLNLTDQYKQTKNWMGLSKEANPFSKGNIGNTMKGIGGAAAMMGTSIGKSEANPRGLFDALDPVHAMAGGRESAVGNAMSDAGVGIFQAGASTGQPYLMIAGAAMKILGGLTNAGFGMKENKQMKKLANESIASNRNFISNASSFDDIKGPASTTATNIYEGGWFTGGAAADKNAEYARDMANAYSWADRSIGNNVRNISSDQVEDFLRNYSAFGGYLTRPKRRRKIKR